MSGDLGSTIVQEACATFAKKHENVCLKVVGKKEELTSLETYKNIDIIDARDVMMMDESVMKVRRKKDSSMVKAITLAKEDEADAVISCGSTGAFYISAMLFLPRLEGVEKSCLMATLPTLNGRGVLMLDVGANAENTPSQLVDFALMGSTYAKYVWHRDDPKVALLNIGSEEKKGDSMHQETYQLLKACPQIHFVGNIEGKEMLNEQVDVIVTDGFTGNVALKTTEGVATQLMKGLKQTMLSSTWSKLGALLSKGALSSLKQKFDPKMVGGALMMGFVKPVIKAHGASDATAFESALNLALEMVEQDVVNKMKDGMHSL